MDIGYLSFDCVLWVRFIAPLVRPESAVVERKSGGGETVVWNAISTRVQLEKYTNPRAT